MALSVVLVSCFRQPPSSQVLEQEIATLAEQVPSIALVTNVNAIFGRYATAEQVAYLSGCEVVLRPNHTYELVNYSDLRRDEESGCWTYTNGYICLRPVSGDALWRKACKYVYCVTVIDAEGVTKQLLLQLRSSGAPRMLANRFNGRMSPQEKTCNLVTFALIKKPDILKEDEQVFGSCSTAPQ